MAPKTLQSASGAEPVTLSFGSDAAGNCQQSGKFADENLAAQAGTPVQLRSQICASGSSPDPVDVVVFDGDPSDGNVIAWKRIYVPNSNSCEGTWFSWTPTSGQHDLVAAILPNSAPPILPNNVLLTSETMPLTEARLAVNVP